MQTERSDYRAALVCTVIANANRDPAKKKDPFTTDDFMPQTGAKKQSPKQSKEQTPDQMLAVVRMWNAALGGNVEEG